MDEIIYRHGDETGRSGTKALVVEMYRVRVDEGLTRDGKDGGGQNLTKRTDGCTLSSHVASRAPASCGFKFRQWSFILTRGSP
jgi:hypothetical protein